MGKMIQNQTVANQKLLSPLKGSVAKTKAKKKKEFKVSVDPTGNVKIVGRPDFNTRAKKLIPKADQGMDLDRRHLVHYDEEIKPYGELVIQKVVAKHGAGTGAVIKAALMSRGCTRLPSSDEALYQRLITEVNSSVANLVPDDASINKAIEIVRANLRKLRQQWVHDPEVLRIFSEMDKNNYHQATDKLKFQASLSLLITGASTDITAAVQLINKDLLDLINGSQTAHELYILIGELENSVTFDISQKASREKIAFTNEWRRAREAHEANARSGVDNADEMLAHLVSLIEKY